MPVFSVGASIVAAAAVAVNAAVIFVHAAALFATPAVNIVITAIVAAYTAAADIAVISDQVVRWKLELESSYRRNSGFV